MIFQQKNILFTYRTNEFFSHKVSDLLRSNFFDFENQRVPEGSIKVF